MLRGTLHRSFSINESYHSRFPFPNSSSGTTVCSWWANASRRCVRYFGWSTSRPLHTTRKQTGGGRYNKNIFACLHRYVAQHQRHWNLFGQATTHAYNSQEHYPRGTTLASLVLLRQPYGPATFVNPTALPTYANAETQPKALRLKLLYRTA